nr:hypothetical protein [Serratia odorifera]
MQPFTQPLSYLRPFAKGQCQHGAAMLQGTDASFYRRDDTLPQATLRIKRPGSVNVTGQRLTAGNGPTLAIKSPLIEVSVYRSETNPPASTADRRTSRAFSNRALNDSAGKSQRRFVLFNPELNFGRFAACQSHAADGSDYLDGFFAEGGDLLHDDVCAQARQYQPHKAPTPWSGITRYWFDATSQPSASPTPTAFARWAIAT